MSFLSADEAIASALYNALSNGLEVFFYPRKQEALAGTNGMESMRMPFLEDSRLVVVLYREQWGKTPWTGVEQTAIQERCLSQGWQSLFFMMLDNTSSPPPWLPRTHIRFNYADFGIEQAVGAIKARVQESGGVIKPLSALKRAEMYRNEAEFQNERQQLRSHAGSVNVHEKTAELFGTIKKLCDDINGRGSLRIQFAADERQCHLRHDCVSLLVTLSDLYTGPELVVREFDKRLGFGNEMLFYVQGKPRLIRESKFLPDINRAGEYGWEEEGYPSKFICSDVLANTIVVQFVDLVERADRGEFRPSDLHGDFESDAY